MTSPTRPARPTNPPTAGTKNINKTRNGGGFNLKPSLTINVSEKGAPTTTAAPAQAGSGQSSKGTPGADFMSNEDIRAFCEHVRKEARNKATERAMDADHLEAVLRTIPDQHGTLSGSRARARRVARWAKKIAAAEKQIQKYAAALYGTFEREYESNLRTVGKGRTQTTPRAPFGWR
ncbi:plasmid transfer protein TraA [Streptomyces seoulensis]